MEKGHADVSLPMSKPLIPFPVLLLSAIVAVAMPNRAPAATSSGEEIIWFDGRHAVTYALPPEHEPVVEVAAGLFRDDMLAVTGMSAVETDASEASIVVSLDESLPVDGFAVRAEGGHISVRGGNGRGMAYGLLELSREAGVSPWVWWGDCPPEARGRLSLPSDYENVQQPSVAYRGVFINDEDWSFRPWAARRSGQLPGSGGVADIDAGTYRRLFELLLRLRANAVWPAMHAGTTAFFLAPGAKAMADSCAIAVGTSHCEPLLRNNLEEWDVSRRGPYNYVINRQAVQQYWAERLDEVCGTQNNLFTIGMRGIHDGSMEGVHTLAEKTAALQQVIDDQQALLRSHIGDPATLEQIFVPYKEVLDIYNNGLSVPDYVTLMWCDDNYGYLTRLSTPDEQLRSGGAGVYYHLSYWGQPHDYLWLTTTQPGLIYQEMRTAYDHQARRLWIANVHDPKVAGYDLELFLDMAWNIDCVNAQTLEDHLHAWLARQFGASAADVLLPAVCQFYRLTAQRKPEFMGWSQVELSKGSYERGLSPVRSTEFSETAFGGELDRYMADYAAVCALVDSAQGLVPERLQDAYFAAIVYPTHAARLHAIRLLEAQRARRYAAGQRPNPGSDAEAAMLLACARSLRAQQQLRALTHRYNHELAGGKWEGLMCDQPRDLPVFLSSVLPVALSESEVDSLLAHAPRNTLSADAQASFATNEERMYLGPSSDGDEARVIARNASQYVEATASAQPVQLLGHSLSAVSLPEGGTLTYQFHVDEDGDYTLYTALIPTQPNDTADLRYRVLLDDDVPIDYSLKEPFRSDRWKQNVLRGQSMRRSSVRLTAGDHTLRITALDPHIVVDQWMLDPRSDRKFYLIPTP